MSELLEFQKEHGGAWETIVAHPAFIAAMQLLNCEKIAAIAALTPEEIEAKGKLVLSELVGHLKHENNLMGLHAKKDFVFHEVREDYPDPIAELSGEMIPPAPANHSPKKPNKPTKKR